MSQKIIWHYVTFWLIGLLDKKGGIAIDAARPQIIEIYIYPPITMPSRRGSAPPIRP